MPTVCPSQYSTSLLSLRNPFQSFHPNALRRGEKSTNFLVGRSTKWHVLRKVLDLQDMRGNHLDFAETSRIYLRRQGFEQVYSRVCGLVDGVGKVLEDVPDPIGKVEVKRVEIMNFGDGVYTMAFQSHSEKKGFEYGAKYAGVRNGIERYYIQR